MAITTPLDPRRLVAETPFEELPNLIGQLAAAQAQALARLTAPAPSNGNGHHAQPEAEKWISPEAAAAIAGVPKERIYAWSKGKRWASRPSRRCLRVSEPGFRRWLAARG